MAAGEKKSEEAGWREERTGKRGSFKKESKREPAVDEGGRKKKTRKVQD